MKDRVRSEEIRYESEYPDHEYHRYLEYNTLGALQEKTANFNKKLTWENGERNPQFLGKKFQYKRM